MTGTRRCFILVGVLWFCFLIKLIFYASFVPLWEGYDEFAHFAFVQHLADTHELPDLVNAVASDEVAESLRLAPVPWTIRQWTPAWMTHDDFWRLPVSTRQQRERELKAIPPALGRQPAPGLRAYEAQQPPLAYLLYWIPYALFHSASLLTRAWIVRMTGCAIASFVVPLGFIVARRVLSDAMQAIGAVAVVVSMPELIMTVDHGGNEPLAIVLATACVYALVRDSRRPRRDALILGCLLGCGLLTKAYFLTIIPAVLLWRTRRWIAIAAATAIAGWWYWHAFRVTGALTGGQIGIAANHSAMPVPQVMAKINWFRVADFALVSHLWLGGWSFLVLRSWMYRTLELILSTGLVGQVGNLVGNLRRVFNRPRPFPPNLAICLTLLLSFWAGLAYYALTTYLATGEAAVLGYYACALVVPEVVCLIAGLAAILPAICKRFIAPTLVVCFAAVEVYGTFLCLMPYYAGVTAHTARGSVPVMQASRLWSGGMAELFRNLAVNKPDFLPVTALATLCSAFLLAVAAIVAVSVLTNRPAPYDV